jgi:hypothetical protein
VEVLPLRQERLQELPSVHNPLPVLQYPIRKGARGLTGSGGGG